MHNVHVYLQNFGILCLFEIRRLYLTVELNLLEDRIVSISFFNILVVDTMRRDQMVKDKIQYECYYICYPFFI